MDVKIESRHPGAELFEAQGQKTYSAMGALWIDAGRLSLISIPSTATIAATREEVDDLLRKSGRVMAIFPTSFATGIQSGAFWVRDRDYGPHSLQRQFRQHVQRAAKDCAVRALDWDTLRLKGRNCHVNSLQRRQLAAMRIVLPIPLVFQLCSGVRHGTHLRHSSLGGLVALRLAVPTRACHQALSPFNHLKNDAYAVKRWDSEIGRRCPQPMQKPRYVIEQR